jgi:predicted nucleotidyltransferase
VSPAEAFSLDLLPRHRDPLAELLRTHVPRAEVLAHGSRVGGGSHPGSDLDLAVRNPTAPERAVAGVHELKDALVDSKLPIRVDVLDWSCTSAKFRAEIEREHFVLQHGARD